MSAELRLCVRCDEYRILPRCPRCGEQTATAPEHPRAEHVDEIERETGELLESMIDVYLDGRPT